MTSKLIDLEQARQRREAERETELERRVIERWTGPVTGEGHCQRCTCVACKKRRNEK